MKNTANWLAFLFVCLATSLLLAQNAPQSFTYQAVARNADGSPLTSTTPFRVSVLQGSPTGAAIYSESCNLTPNQFGVVTLPIGEAGPAAFSSIDWGAGPYFLKVELDFGSGFVQMGQPELIRSVPYALYGEDADADPANELQSLDLSGNTLAISGGNAVTLPVGSDDQTLSISGANLSISEGNTVTLPDADPANELQTLSLSGNDLNLSNGGGNVSLASFATPWTKVSTNIYYNTGKVGIGLTNPSYPLHVEASSGVTSLNGVITGMYTGTSATDVVGVKGVSKPTDNYGIGGYFQGGYKSVYAYTTSSGIANYYGVQGVVSGGTGKNYAIHGSATGGGTNYAIYGLANGTSGTNWAGYFVGPAYVSGNLITGGPSTSGLVTMGEYQNSGAGHVTLDGPSGHANVFLGYYVNADRGNIRVADINGTYKAGIHVNSSNQGYVWADVKSFRMEYPGRSGQEIWYASIEGPEAAAYERGTATLENGEVFVPYSETFGIVVNPKTVTITLTPHSADTYGLAVIQKEADGFRVKELKGGNGNFGFDYTVMGVRKGFEDFEVVRQAEPPMPEQ